LSLVSYFLLLVALSLFQKKSTSYKTFVFDLSPFPHTHTHSLFMDPKLVAAKSEAKSVFSVYLSLFLESRFLPTRKTSSNVE
jgi:hypothetical protein